MPRPTKDDVYLSISNRGRPYVHPTHRKIANTIKLPRWITVWLNQHEESKASLIENAIVQQYGLKVPGMDWDDVIFEEGIPVALKSERAAAAELALQESMVDED